MDIVLGPPSKLLIVVVEEGLALEQSWCPSFPSLPLLIFSQQEEGPQSLLVFFSKAALEGQS